MEYLKAIVVKIYPKGKHGPYAVAVTEELNGSITFSLEPTVWSEEEWPDEGTVVVLGKIRQKRAGWRAKQGRFWTPSDEQTERSGEMKEMTKALARHEIKTLVPSCGKKTLQLLDEIKLSRREVEEVGAVVKISKITANKVIRILKMGMTFEEMTEIVELGTDYGDLASYNQLVRAYRMCGDFDTLEHFLTVAEKYLRYQPMRRSESYTPRIPQRRFGYLLHVAEDKFLGDIMQVARVLQDYSPQQIDRILQGRMPREIWYNSGEDECGGE